MNDATSIVTALALIAACATLPLYAYAHLPLESLKKAFEHSRFAGIGT
jgi:hypothetical protein